MAAEYNNDEIMKMQKDAERRVREMHARSRSAIDRTPPLTANSPNRAGSQPQRQAAQRQLPREEKPEELAPAARNPQGGFLGEGNVLGSLMSRFFPSKDSGILELIKNNRDTVILMTILIILYTEKADELLILAIIYIML